MDRRTKYGIFLLVLLIVGLAVYGILYQLHGAARTLINADIHITAPGLTASFEGNEGLADSLYLYKVISVSGVFERMTEIGPGRFIVRLSGDRTGKSMVECHMDSLYTREDLLPRRGDNVAIRGTCAGRWVDVILLQCIIEK